MPEKRTIEGFEMNQKNKGDGLQMLKGAEEESVAVVFFDPQYRGILDHQHYGNEGVTRGKARCSLTQMDEETIASFIKEIDRVLKPSGHLFLWVDKYHLCEGIDKWIIGTSLQKVDLIIWDKKRISMGARSRYRAEYLIVLQKAPLKAKGIWTDHGIPDVWAEKVVKTHPHSKPVDLQKRLILATTCEGDLVLDPAAGGYSVMEACRGTGRDFLGCDIEFGPEEDSEKTA